MGIVTIVRLAIVAAAMQLLLTYMQCTVVLVTATVLGPSSYTWHLHNSDQCYTWRSGEGYAGTSLFGVVQQPGCLVA
jgi:hypothetical protein